MLCREQAWKLNIDIKDGSKYTFKLMPTLSVEDLISNPKKTVFYQSVGIADTTTNIEAIVDFNPNYD